MRTASHRRLDGCRQQDTNLGCHEALGFDRLEGWSAIQELPYICQLAIHAVETITELEDSFGDPNASQHERSVVPGIEVRQEREAKQRAVGTQVREHA